MGNLHGVFLESQKPSNKIGEIWRIDENEEAAINHIRALRLKSGDTFVALNGHGLKVITKIIDQKIMQLETLEHTQISMPKVSADIFLSPPKGDDLDRCIQICVELGVRRLHLFSSDHCAQKSALKLGRLKRIAQSSCEQSLNPWLPEIIDEGTDGLGAMLKKAQGESSSVLVFDELLASTEPFFRIKHTSTSFAFFIGPEGGWSKAEREQFQFHNITRASLGAIVLKVPTALCAGLSVLRSST